MGDTSGLVRTVLWGLLLSTVGSALLGLGVGTAVRHSAGAVAAAGLPNLLHASILWGWVIAALLLGTALLVRRDAD